jgi:hypothetical protein
MDQDLRLYRNFSDSPLRLAILPVLRISWVDPLAMLESVTHQESAMRKRKASLYPSFGRPALPVLPARSRSLARPNC